VCAGGDYILAELVKFGGLPIGEHWLISGANRGIGLELSRRLLARGDHVTSSVRSEEARAGLLVKLAPQNGQADTLVFDTRDDEAIRAAARTVSKPIDVLVANAGACGPDRQSMLDMVMARSISSLSMRSARCGSRKHFCHCSYGRQIRVLFSCPACSAQWRWTARSTSPTARRRRR